MALLGSGVVFGATTAFHVGQCQTFDKSLERRQFWNIEDNARCRRKFTNWKLRSRLRSALMRRRTSYSSARGARRFPSTQDINLFDKSSPDAPASSAGNVSSAS